MDRQLPLGQSRWVRKARVPARLVFITRRPTNSADDVAKTRCTSRRRSAPVAVSKAEAKGAANWRYLVAQVEHHSCSRLNVHQSALHLLDIYLCLYTQVTPTLKLESSTGPSKPSVDAPQAPDDSATLASFPAWPKTASASAPQPLLR